MKAAWTCLLTLILIQTALPAMAEETPVVDAPQGAVRGVRASEGGHAFRGIPYAVPPTGDLRWRPPVPVPDWQGVREAAEPGPACMQPASGGTSIYSEELHAMSEDCLSLNVWAPADARDAPVMVWIHGGSLLTGASGSPFYDGAKLAEEGVVVVSINYRLGVFGFFAHPELTAESHHAASGNYGLLDQIEALRWVERNIASFGGDPGNVTIFGESAGALSAMYLLASPLAEGLFDKVIAQSPYMVPTPELKNAVYGLKSGEDIGLMVSENLGAENLAALRALDAQALNAAPIQGGPIPQATIDGWVLTRQLTETFDAGEQAPVPVLAGFNSGEIRSLPGLLPPVPDSPAGYEAAMQTKYGDLSDTFLALYPGDAPRESLLAATRDTVYGWSAQRLARKQVTTGAPSYVYMFDQAYPAVEAQNLTGFHASEIPYVFGVIGDDDRLPPNWPKPPADAENKAVSEAMRAYWTSFARTGQPRAPGQPDWRPVSDEGAYMIFRAGPQTGHDLLPGHYDLMEEIACRRKSTNQSWMPLVGVAAPVIPQTECAAKEADEPG